MPARNKVEPEIMRMLDELKMLVGSGFRNYSFGVFEDADDINYHHAVVDEAGNSITVAERKIKPQPTPAPEHPTGPPDTPPGQSSPQ